ncbi:MAG: leucine-rich repeat domain-containing protein [Clostridia bacterium]|nr:leucine-rich repeat domain-containing protein [Clostridia bacterium]MBQ8872995.1 leucine-rich repeat domain-containing protein [Clostridia bacterium]MBQ9706261.1 leucine-rich repeat domain-containing protein [Clostridia bacterium]
MKIKTCYILLLFIVLLFAISLLTACSCYHEKVVDPAVTPTCTTTGLTEGSHCSICGQILVAQQTISATGHTFDIWSIIKEPSCTEAGLEIGVCSCGQTQTKVIVALGHTYESTVVGATCTEEGYTTHTCQTCDDTYIDSQIKALGHDIVLHDAQAESCTQIGWNEYQTCNRCDYSTYQEIPAFGHYYVNRDCITCGALEPSLGLEFALSADRKYYSLVGMGTCTDDRVAIPQNYEGKPVLHIADNVFSGTSITKIVIPSCVTTIGASAFLDCVNLESIVIENDSNLVSIGEQAFSGCSNLKSIVIPNGVTAISNSTFYNCKNLSTVEIADDSLLTSIGNMAFCYCEKLEEINIPYNVKSIGNDAFYSCKSLTTLAISANSLLTTIGEKAFYYCKELQAINIPIGVTRIEYRTFDQCYNLQNVTIDRNSQLLYIGDSAFGYCRDLESIYLPDSVSTIGLSAFYGCSSLQSIVIPKGVVKIERSVFRACFNLESVILQEGSLRSIDDMAFASCYALTNVSIPASVTSIGHGVFENCTGLMSIDVNRDNTNYKSIDGNLYSVDGKVLIQYALGKLDEYFVVPMGVETIAYTAFGNCSNLKSLTLTADVKTIEDWIEIKGTKLSNIIVDENNPYYMSLDGNVYTKDGSTIIRYATAKEQTSFIIPDSVTKIGDYAFNGATNLISVQVPQSVTMIGSYAFEDCTNLTSFTIPQSVNVIDINILIGCEKLESVVFEKTDGWYCDPKLGNKYGTLVDVTDTVRNVVYFLDGEFSYVDCYWYFLDK